MFRFIHAADPHLDSPLQGLEAREGAPVAVLRGATRRAFENLVRLAVRERVNFVVIAGDLYDGDWRDYSTGLFFRGQMAKLKAEGIPVYLIAGNHDAASVISRRLTLPDNVRTFSTRVAETAEVPGLPVVIHGRGFPHRSVPENLVTDYPEAVPGKFNVGLLHTSLNGRPGHDAYAPCSERDLREKGYQYWALGHIHQPEIVSEDPWVVFSGNCQGRHVRELGARGCRVVTVNDALEVERVDGEALDVVRWAALEVEAGGVEMESELWLRVREALEGALAGADGRLLAVRVTLVGATPLHGVLHWDPRRVQAEVVALAQDFGEDVVWVERVTAATSPVYDLDRLAERDALTRTVLETLRGAGGALDQWPSEVVEMLSVLPPDVRSVVESELGPDGRVALMADVRSIILEALRTGEGREA